MSKDQTIRLSFPVCGIDVAMAFDRQPIKQTRTGERHYTTPRAVNVRPYDAAADRSRGGSRPGVVKYLPNRPADLWWVTQDLATIVIASAVAEV